MCIRMHDINYAISFLQYTHTYFYDLGHGFDFGRNARTCVPRMNPWTE